MAITISDTQTPESGTPAILRRLTDLWREHKAAKDLASRNEGFAFAMVKYFNNSITTEKLSSLTDMARSVEVYDAYHGGIDAALQILFSLDEDEDEADHRFSFVSDVSFDDEFDIAWLNSNHDRVSVVDGASHSMPHSDNSKAILEAGKRYHVKVAISEV